MTPSLDHPDRSDCAEPRLPASTWFIRVGASAPVAEPRPAPAAALAAPGADQAADWLVVSRLLAARASADEAAWPQLGRPAA